MRAAISSSKIRLVGQETRHTNDELNISKYLRLVRTISNSGNQLVEQAYTNATVIPTPSLPHTSIDNQIHRHRRGRYGNLGDHQNNHRLEARQCQ